MKANILDIDGKKIKQIELPKCFSQEIRGDIISKVLETKKSKQPYSPSPVAGKQYSASGILVHQRHVWKSQYGRGMSRVPRKILSRRGSQFNWEGATAPGTKGGRRAHPPKVVSMINTKKINKKEALTALISALSASTNEKEIAKRYSSLKNKKIENLPLVVESKFLSLKTKDLFSSLKKILGDLYEIAIRKKKLRSGKGKMRGRKYKTSAGMILVIGNNEKLKTKAFDMKRVKELNVIDLANGGAGRLTLYTEQAIKDLGERLK